MTTIHVTASREYDVLVQPGLLDDAGTLIARTLGAGRTAAVVAGETVAGLYAARLEASLARAGFRVVTFTYPGGEHFKTLATYAALLDFLAAHRLSRSDLIVALGGGVTGDLAGFAAATYQRGIPFVQVPTTLLAAVDSSVGGKTAVNLDERQKSGRLFLSAEPCAL
ncbi:MAG: iron-containing alcohol dehydrogenase [Oscillospiraceae bacterium]